MRPTGRCPRQGRSGGACPSGSCRTSSATSRSPWTTPTGGRLERASFESRSPRGGGKLSGYGDAGVPPPQPLDPFGNLTSMFLLWFGGFDICDLWGPLGRLPPPRPSPKVPSPMVSGCKSHPSPPGSFERSLWPVCTAVPRQVRAHPRPPGAPPILSPGRPLTLTTRSRSQV